MPQSSFLAALSLAAVLLAARPSAASEVPRQPTAHELAALLRAGGLVLYLRHPETDRTQADRDAIDLADCATQRNLSEAGRRTSSAIGDALRAAGVALERVVTSEYCRARDAAALMGIEAEADGLLNDGGRMVAAGPDSPHAEAVRAMLRRPPAAGRSTLLVAHRPNLADAAGPAFADLAEGEMAAFRPTPDEAPGFRPLARIRPGDWPAITAATAP